MVKAEAKIHYRTCPLCEATCGLEIHTVGEKVVGIKGDALDPLSKGYLCPKGYSLKELHEDRDRLKQPMVRRGSEWYEVSWEEAFTEVKEGLQPLIEEHGSDALAVYLGNPNVHNLAGALYVPIFLKMLRSRYTFSASTMDQMPKQLVAEMLYGNDFSIPIPDIDHTDYMLIIGANPLVSNGSMMTAPGMRDRLKALKSRGGRFVVIDPVKTQTAKVANEYFSIRPGTDAYFLFAMVHTLFEEKLVNLNHLKNYVNGVEEVEKAAQDYAPERVQKACGIPAHEIRKLARELAQAKSAAVYGRMGTCTQEFGTLNTWLIDALNVLTGNLDREGGVLFPLPAAGGRNVARAPRKKETYRYGRFQSSIRGLPEVLGELPVATMAEEIEKADPIRAFITVAGNPVLSTPNGDRLQNALKRLDFMVCVDGYLNETTRLANVILPPLSPLERSHYDLSFYQLSVRNIAHYSKPVFPKAAGHLDEWEILLELTASLFGSKLGEKPAKAIDDGTFMKMVQAEAENPLSPIYERSLEDIVGQYEAAGGPERILDFLLRVGPYGDHFGTNPEGLTLTKVAEHEHGVDLGPLRPRIPEVLLTSTQKVELAPMLILKDVARLADSLASPRTGYVLIGRRDLRSNNSWMHNLHVLVKGKNRCTVQIHPEDAVKENLAEGELIRLSSRVGSLQAPVEITDAVMPGVVSLPHGWGHDFPEARLNIASDYAGINANLLTDDQVVDAISGNVVFNGVPVEMKKVMEEESVLQSEQF